ncbi:UvrD-helicase domain-containing protein [Mesorhizobium sp. M0011]|uniref:UvrD-helicase domain-containing protein n=1 Tax=Mesorhizobium sp. M0011 TaxID=2956839 RepID=UPI00333B4D15
MPDREPARRRCSQRADFLLRTRSCRYPKRILAISFKVDASTNPKARVRRRCGHQLGERFDSFTFHRFALRIIQQFRLALTGQDVLAADFSVGPARIQGQSITFRDMIPLAKTIVEGSVIARNALRKHTARYSWTSSRTAPISSTASLRPVSLEPARNS